jgi:(R)-2-hydroxyacyl-CoA dehydratese activating ATPase
MACYMGIDIGSTSSKGILIDDNNTMVRHLQSSGINYRNSAEELKNELLKKAGLSDTDISYIVMTGHTESVTVGNEYATDIRCFARGIHRVFPQAKTVIDVQGQSSQVILIGQAGQVKNFVISEKCAAGSGRFMDVVANVLRIKIEEIGKMSLAAKNPVVFTTGCAVFGESEAISRVAEGISKEDILAGVHQALAEKISALVNRLGLEEPCAMGGGGALNIGLIKSLEKKLGIRLLVPPEPQFITALGAAIIAREKVTTPKVIE